MSIVTKIILDTSEYNRLLAIEKAYHELKSLKDETSDKQQSGSGIVNKCTCETKESCKCTPPLSEIIAENEKARAVDIPPRGILPSITDPHEQGFGNTANNKSETTERDKELFEHSNFRALADDKEKWYFLRHFSCLGIRYITCNHYFS